MPKTHDYTARLTWTGASSGATDASAAYSREYLLEIAGKAALRGSADPMFKGDAALHNPEDLLLASLAGCHMLSYLYLAARAGIGVVAYEDNPTGQLTLEGGTGRFTRVVLHPTVTIAAGDENTARELHEKAHAACFIANSVNFPVSVELQIVRQ